MRAGADTGNYRVIQTKFNPDIAYIASGAKYLIASIHAVILMGLYVF